MKGRVKLLFGLAAILLAIWMLPAQQAAAQEGMPDEHWQVLQVVVESRAGRVNYPPGSRYTRDLEDFIRTMQRMDWELVQETLVGGTTTVWLKFTKLMKMGGPAWMPMFMIPAAPVNSMLERIDPSRWWEPPRRS